MNTESKIYLCSFASLDLSISAFRFYTQACSMGIFDSIFIYNESTLNLEFKRHFAPLMYKNFPKKRETKRDEIIESSIFPQKSYTKDSIESSLKMQNFERTRGFGYYSWKPQVILQTLEQINENDILIYADIGCNFIPEFANNLLKKLEILESESMLTFALENIAKTYTKAYTFAFFDVLNDKSYTNTNMIKAGVIFMKKCEKTQIIMQEWLESIWQDFSIIDDSKSKIKNFPEFKAHRHDQSIFSILAKKHKVLSLPDYHNVCESEYACAIAAINSRLIWLIVTRFFC